MAARHRLPVAPGDLIRVEPYRVTLRTVGAKVEWRRIASAFYEAARAWRTELKGFEGWNDRGVISFASWKGLRAGEPRTFGAYELARGRVLDAETDHPRDVADKIQIAAEVLGVADPRSVLHGWAEDVPEGGWTVADRIFAALWRDAHSAAKRVEAERAKARRKGKR